MVHTCLFTMNIPIETIRKCKRCDPSAQKSVYETLMPYLNGICRRYLFNESLKGDALQESFIKIFTKIDQFEEERGAFKSWATKITINTCLQMGKKASSRNEIPLTPAEYQIPISPEIIARLGNEEILKILSNMPVDFFHVFNLFIVDGFSHDEIGEMLGINAALSRKRLARARDWIARRTELKSMIS